MKIGAYEVSNTRGVCPLKHRVRVTRFGGELVAEIYPAQLDPDGKGFSDPLRYLRRYPQSASRREFIRQMSLNGVPDDDIRTILTFPDKSK